MRGIHCRAFMRKLRRVFRNPALGGSVAVIVIAVIVILILSGGKAPPTKTSTVTIPRHYYADSARRVSSSNQDKHSNSPQTSWRDERDAYGAFKCAAEAALSDMLWAKGILPELASTCIEGDGVKQLGSIRAQEYSVDSWLEDSSGRVWYLVRVKQVRDGDWEVMRDNDGLMAYWYDTSYGEVWTRFSD